MENLSTIAITLITVLGSAGAWRFYEKKLDKKKEDELDYKYECRSRFDKLEWLITESSKEKEEMRKTILELSTKVAHLSSKIEFLEKRNRELEKG